MIIKHFELNRINLDKSKIFLFYGKNEWLKKETLQDLLSNKNKISNYEENEILNNQDNFIENLLTKSLFEEEKIIMIKRATDKILKTIEKTVNEKIIDAVIVIDAENLEKK